MGVELFINDQAVELKDSSKLQFNFTIGDIFTIATVQVSYSNVFEAPLTPSNTLAMGGLGLIGNNSQIPYQKVAATLKYDGFDIVSNGRLLLEETSQSYRMGILEGMVDFFKDIENKTIGKDLDIDELKHEKTMNNFVRSIEQNIPYRYVVADFGGKMQLPDETITIDYLMPVVKLSYFWNKIFETFGYTYSGSIFSNPDFTEAHITYPKAPSGEPFEALISRTFKNNYRDNNPVPGDRTNVFEFPQSYSWDFKTGPGFDNWNFQATETKKYRLRFRPAGYLMYGNNQGSYHFEVWRGTQFVKTFFSQYGSTVNFNDYFLDFDLTAGEVINFKIVSPAFGAPSYLRIMSLEVEVYEMSIGSFDFAEAFADFSIKDFVKEIIWRYALIPFIDTRTKNIQFLTIDEKVNFNNYVDWSGKYVNREKETYLYGTSNYGQSNIFQHKYNDESDSFRNGILSIGNANLEPSKVIAASKIYAAEERIRKFRMAGKDFNSTLYPLWQSEIVESVENNQNVQKIEYKGLSNRYYIMKLTRVNAQGKFKSEALNSTVQTTPFYFISNANNTHYNDLVAKYYPTYQKIMNNFKMHEIEVALSLPDILELDFRKLYYFEQEASFYILNKLQWEEGKTCKGEFIKINK